MWHETQRVAQRPRCATPRRVFETHTLPPEALISDVLNGVRCTRSERAWKSQPGRLIDGNLDEIFRVQVNTGRIMHLAPYLTVA